MFQPNSQVSDVERDRSASATEALRISSQSTGGNIISSTM